MKMNVYILIIFLMAVTSVITDEQCSCDDLVFLKQLVQQEMFERKLENSMLRWELQKISKGPGLIETDSMTGSAISTRVERLEQRFAEFENTSDIGHQSGPEHLEQSKKSTSNDNNEKNMSFQTLVKHTLKNEKMERVNFVSQVQRQMENLNDIVSKFKTTTDIFVHEQAKKWSVDYKQSERNISQQVFEFKESLELSLQDDVMQMTSGIENIVDDMKEMKQNASKKIENLRATVTNELEENKLRIKTVLKELIDNMTGIKEDVNECITEVDSLKSDINDVKTDVRNSEVTVTQLQGQFEEHITVAERQFSFVNRKVGTCRGANWKRHGNKCYYFRHHDRSWIESSERCRAQNGELVTIQSKEENDYITANIKAYRTDFWIGLNDRQKENSWQWKSTKSSLKSESFSNWAPNEPDNREIGVQRMSADCVYITSNGQWYDSICDYVQRFICQRDPEL